MISSRRNERIKTIRGLRACKDEYAFLEGPHLVEEMVTTGTSCLEVLATPEFLSTVRGRAIRAELARPVVEVTASVLATLADSKTPQGVVAVAKVPRGGVEELPRTDGAVYLFLDRVQDPGNLGALVRSAEATGVAGVALAPGCAHPNHPKAARASGGSLLREPTAIGVSVEALLAHLAEVEPRLVALEPAGGADLYRTRLRGTIVLALGSEGSGLGGQVEARADLSVTIPVAPPVESLNVTVAASVALAELARRRRGDVETGTRRL